MLFGQSLIYYYFFSQARVYISSRVDIKRLFVRSVRQLLYVGLPTVYHVTPIHRHIFIYCPVRDFPSGLYNLPAHRKGPYFLRMCRISKRLALLLLISVTYGRRTFWKLFNAVKVTWRDVTWRDVTWRVVCTNSCHIIFLSEQFWLLKNISRRKKHFSLLSFFN
jgi:hypothetical protein